MLSPLLFFCHRMHRSALKKQYESDHSVAIFSSGQVGITAILFEEYNSCMRLLLNNFRRILQRKKVKRVFGVLIVFFTWFANASHAQTAQPHLRISLLTCGPGDELYSIFGHTALRIIDSSQNTDLIYNYGTFDFQDPDFYPKFVRGKLNYFLSVEELHAFLYEYQVTNRSVTEQELQMNDSTKLAIKNAIAENLIGNIRFYKYDFLYDNCTSRVKNILVRYAGMKIDTKLVPNGTSFRDMIHEYLDRGSMAWTKLGMDILLGSRTDKAVTIDESMFLPDYLMKGVDSSATSTNPLMLHKQAILPGSTGNRNTTNWPLFVFAIISAVILLVSNLKSKRAWIITRLIDFILFCLTGLIGCFLLFTWFGTDHSSFAANYNLLWALPTNVIAAATLWKRPIWLSKYFFVTSLVYGFLLACFFWLPQQLNPAFIPLVILLLFRSVKWAKA